MVVAAAQRDEEPEHRNEVHLVGRLAGEPVSRDLPSGDVVVGFRLVVDRLPRPQSRPAGRRVPSVDALECAAWRRGVQRSLAGCEPGDLVEVEGALRRRFWRSPGGPASRSEVEAVRIRRVRRAAAG